MINKALTRKNIVILRKASNVLVITLPSHILQKLEWEEGDFLGLKIDGDALVVRKGKINFGDE